jgi:hypothetical protein
MGLVRDMVGDTNGHAHKRAKARITGLNDIEIQLEMKGVWNGHGLELMVARRSLCNNVIFIDLIPT